MMAFIAIDETEEVRNIGPELVERAAEDAGV